MKTPSSDALDQPKRGSKRVNLAGGNPFFTPDRLAYVGIFIFAIALYYRSLRFEPVWDDHQILNGSAIGGGTFQGALTQPFLGHYYRPFNSLSYSVDFQLFGQNPFLWHQTSILLHAIGCLVIGWLAHVVSGNKWAGVLAALFFAIQPSQIGPTAWIGGRIDSLSALLSALFLAITIRFFQSDNKWYLSASAVALFVAAMVKEQNLAIVLALPFLQVAFGNPSKRRLATVGATIAVPLVTFLALWMQHRANMTMVLPPTFYEAFVRVGGGFIHYLTLLITPTVGGQSTISLANYDSWLWGALGLVLLGGTFFGITKLLRSDKPTQAMAITCLILYLPVSNAIPMPSLLVAPYRVAAVGAVVSVILGIFAQRAWDARNRVVLAGLAAVLVWALSITTISIPVWSSEVGFFNSVAQHDPHSVIGRLNSVSSLIQNQRHAEAVAKSDEYLDWLTNQGAWRDSVEAGKGLSLGPDATRRLSKNTGVLTEDKTYLAGLITNRAVAQFSEGKEKPAKGGFQSAILLNPECAPALFALADMVTPTDKVQAVDLLQRAIKIRGTVSEHSHLAAVLRDLGRYSDAADSYRNALKSADWIGDLWVDLADVEQRAGHSLLAHEAIDMAQTKMIANKQRYQEVKGKIESLNADGDRQKD